MNPGSTGTKLALYEGEQAVWSELLSSEPCTRDGSYMRSEYELRVRQVRQFLQTRSVEQLAAVVGRGGLLAPVPGGTYVVNEAMCTDAFASTRGVHASNLGCILARQLADDHHAQAFIVDPVSTDELSPSARVSGLKELPRQSLAHYLSIKSVYRLACAELGVTEGNFIVAHLGSGITVAAIKDGKVIDTTNANDDGPFSPERSGTLPAGDLIRLCMSGKYTQGELSAQIVSNSGLKGYLGTGDAREVEERIVRGDEQAELVFQAMIYQIAKEIGAMAAVFAGEINAILCTGGLSYSEYVVKAIKDRVGFIAPIIIYRGEREMDALAQGALRVLRGQERPRQYPEGAEIS